MPHKVLVKHLNIYFSKEKHRRRKYEITQYWIPVVSVSLVELDLSCEDITEIHIFELTLGTYFLTFPRAGVVWKWCGC